MQKLMTVKEVAETLGISQSLVYRLVSKGEIVCFRVNSAIRFSMEQIEEYLNGTRKKVNSVVVRKKYF